LSHMARQYRSDIMSTVSVNGTQLYYEEAGSGHPLLFIHGMCGDASVWTDQMQRLAPRFHCFAYDRRGHSRSPLGQITQETVELHADDAAQLIMALGLAPCILVGSSGGARIATDVIRRYPRLIAGAVLSEPPIMALMPDGGAALLGEIKLAVEPAVARGGPRAAIDAFFELLCPGLWRTLPEERRNVPYRANAHAFFGDIAAPTYQITPADLALIRVPTVVMSGDESHPMLRAVAGVLADNIPGARLIALTHSGHVTYAEQPAAFADAVLTFAGALPSAAR
jgi:pimeloyl-ACP methyl ester carboxylesterase